MHPKPGPNHQPKWSFGITNSKMPHPAPAILAGRAALPVLAIPLDAATPAHLTPAHVPRARARQHTAIDEQDAFSAKLRAASHRADAACPPAPPEIARTVLETNPDFAVLSESERDIGQWSKTIPNHTIKSAISRVESEGRAQSKRCRGAW